MARAALLLVGLLLAACAGSPGGRSPADDAVGEWELVAGTADGAVLPVPPGARATLELDGAHAGGVSFCNHYSTEYSVDGDTIAFAGLGGTDMGCEPAVMAAETGYLRALAAADTVTLDGTDLLLTGDGVELRYRPVPPVPTSELVGTDWVLDTLLDDDTAASVLGSPRLRLDPDGAVTGNTGCRDFTGTWTTRGDLVVLETLDAGTSGCPEDVGFQDDHVLAVLGDGFQVSVEENRLTALDPDGRGLVYRAG
jgi:heat shock protein HslJ